MKKLFSTILLTLLLTSMLTLTFNIQPVLGSGTIHIRADGSIDPPDAPISTVDNVTYTLTGNITSDADSIVMERGNIVINGAGCTLQGTGTWVYLSKGIEISGRTNVTVKNTQIQNFAAGIFLNSSSDNSVSGNNVTNNWRGIYLDDSSHNSISGNNMANNQVGIQLRHSSNNIICHNNFVNNTQQARFYETGYTNVWDDGYPIGGNYWSDYLERYPDAEEMDGSGLWDTPYVIDEDNQDNYPLVNPWSPPELTPTVDFHPRVLNLG